MTDPRKTISTNPSDLLNFVEILNQATETQRKEIIRFTKELEGIDALTVALRKWDDHPNVYLGFTYNPKQNNALAIFSHQIFTVVFGPRGAVKDIYDTNKKDTDKRYSWQVEWKCFVANVKRIDQTLNHK